jgi:hypothetical protein
VVVCEKKPRRDEETGPVPKGLRAGAADAHAAHGPSGSEAELQVVDAHKVTAPDHTLEGARRGAVRHVGNSRRERRHGDAGERLGHRRLTREALPAFLHALARVRLHPEPGLDQAAVLRANSLALLEPALRFLNEAIGDHRSPSLAREVKQPR